MNLLIHVDFYAPIPAVIPGSLIAAGIVGTLIVLFTSTNERPPIYQPVLVIIAFGMSIVWIFLSAEQMVELLEAIGAAIGINPSYVKCTCNIFSALAITLLAWGNSIGDLFSDIAIARQVWL